MNSLAKPVTAVLGLLAVAAGTWALVSPASFAEYVNFAPHRHFVHDVGAFQLGIGATLLLALVWRDVVGVALAGYALGAAAHTVSHVLDADIGGSAVQTGAIGISALLAAAALVPRRRPDRTVPSR
jgi:hypothetical protein